MGKITILKLKQDVEKLELVEVDAGLDTMQSIVGGYIERVAFHSKIDLWINEEGLLIDLPHNFDTVVIDAGQVVPVHHIVGDVFFASHDEEGNTVSLSPYQIKLVEDMFRYHRKVCVVR